MKRIVKGKEPSSLTEHRTSQHSSYANLNKDGVRASLLAEQGHLCCYCMKRIPESNKTPGSKIEHFLCQDDYRQEELNYSNMLLACLGNEGSPKTLQTCDTFKGNKSLCLNPSSNDRNIEGLINYKANGEIYSNDEQLNNELNSVLNLNMQSLKRNRQVIYEEVQNRIRLEGKRQKNHTLKRRFLENEKQKWLALNQSKYSEFCMVGVYVIEKKLKKLG